MITTTLARIIESDRIADRDMPAIAKIFSKPESFADAIARVKADTVDDEDLEPDLDDYEYADRYDDDGAGEQV